MNHIRGTIFKDRTLSRETKIYRTMSIERLFQMFEDNTNVVVRPSLWDDTFENLALSSVFETEDEQGTIGSDDLYGQCWTLHDASDAIWRIYSNGTDGVRIRTTAGKLFDSLAENAEFGSKGETHLGSVKYCSESDLKQYAEVHFVNKGINVESIARTLTIKREEFSHEKEVRLIYQSDTTLDTDVLKYAIDPHQMIDQIMLHPQLGKDVADRQKSRIEKYLNYKGKVKPSLLYTLPKGFVFKI